MYVPTPKWSRGLNFCECLFTVIWLVGAMNHVFGGAACLDYELSRENGSLSQMQIGIVMYANENISQYADMAYKINAAYASSHNYSITLFSERTGSNYEPRDPRWNKVKVVANAINPKNGIYRSYDYIVWLDSDLIILDFSLLLQDLISAHPTADLILSSEMHAQTGVANTGSFILRNSAWSRALLDDWWYSFDRSVAHDQIFFDRLYKSRLPDIRDHVVLLPPDSLNSIPPAMLHQSQNSKVLHLMGEHAGLRMRIFSLGLREVIRAAKLQTAPQHQLGLTQMVLFNEAKTFFIGILEKGIKHMHMMTQNDTIANVDAFFANASESREALIQLDLYQNAGAFRDEAMLHQYRSEMYQLVVNVSEILTLGTSVNKQQVIQAWHLCALHGNDMLPFVESFEEKKDLLYFISKHLNLLSENVHVSSLSYIKELQQRHLTNIGQFEFDNGNYNMAARALLDSIESGRQLGDLENLLYRVDALVLLGSIHCFRGGVEISYGMTYFRSAIDIQKSLLYAEEQLKTDHLKLAETLLRAASCAAKQVDTMVASEFLEDAVQMLRSHHDINSAMKLLDTAQKLRASIQRDLQYMKDTATTNFVGGTIEYSRKKMKKRTL